MRSFRFGVQARGFEDAQQWRDWPGALKIWAKPSNCLPTTEAPVKPYNETMRTEVIKR